MTVRQIRHYGDPVLRTPADPIGEITDQVRALIQDLLDTTDMDGRAGVAAPQIGVGLRAFSWHIDGKLGYIINPEIVELGGEPSEIDEGCLSVPGLWFPTRRYPYAKVRGIDLDGNEVVLEGEGLMAQMLQHECDHLDGTVYVDTLAKEHRREALRQIRAADWF
ncbi:MULTISPECIES: peptide deformylase [Gulosibacter]|uniref:peptide deformylase n=1 Tax=Gulosibacter TaxID=256818 RepID=UPI0019182A3F|nr:peptide deformylase [Gulosibacter hominis]